MNPVIIIPARMKATRLPDKPLAPIGGIPMIVHVWKRAVESNIGKVYVACDDLGIVDAIQKVGGEAIITKVNHMSGSDRIYEALQEIDPLGAHDIIVNVQGDVPTIEPKIIRAVLEPLKDPTVDIATLACEIKEESEITDPAVVKPILASNNYALYFTRTTAPHGEGKYYHHIGIYAYRRKALENFIKMPPSPLELRERLEQLRALEAGMKIGVAIVDTIPLGVDTPEHLEKARRILGV